MLNLLINRTKQILTYMLCLMAIKVIASLWRMEGWEEFFGSLLGAVMAAGILTVPVVVIVSIIDWFRGRAYE